MKLVKFHKCHCTVKKLCRLCKGKGKVKVIDYWNVGLILPRKEGKKIIWEVSDGDGGGMDCNTQIEAMIISELWKIKSLLKKIERKI